MAKTALITGASSGIGLEFAKIFAKEGYDLVLVARREDRLDALKSQLEREYKIKVFNIIADLSQPESIMEVYQKFNEFSSQIHVLVNNAGLGAHGFLKDVDLNDLRQTMRVNMDALVSLTKLFLPKMLERKEGFILNVASSAAFVPGPSMAVYYASKAFVLSFSEALANELQGSGVSSTVLCPGPTKTEFQSLAYQEDPAVTAKKKIPTAEEVAWYGYNAMKKRQVVAIPDFSSRLIPFLIRFFPRALIVRIVRIVQLKYISASK